MVMDHLPVAMTATALRDFERTGTRSGFGDRRSFRIAGGATRGCLERSRTTHGPRDQESADADSAFGRTNCKELRECHVWHWWQ